VPTLEQEVVVSNKHEMVKEVQSEQQIITAYLKALALTCSNFIEGKGLEKTLIELEQCSLEEQNELKMSVINQKMYKQLCPEMEVSEQLPMERVPHLKRKERIEKALIKVQTIPIIKQVEPREHSSIYEKDESMLLLS